MRQTSVRACLCTQVRLGMPRAALVAFARPTVGFTSMALRSFAPHRSAPLLAVALLLSAGCGEQTGPSAAQTRASDEPRIVSLSPAISRTLLDLGLADHLVGRSRFCRAVDRAVPVVGDLTHVAYERLIRLEPTHILLQPTAAGIDPKLATLARERGWTLGQWPHLDWVEDISRLVLELPSVVYPAGSEGFQVVTRRATEVLQALQASLQPGDRPLFRGRTLLLSGVDPVMAFGQDTYLHDILTRFGGRNAIEARGWVQLSLEDVVRIDPQAMVLVLEEAPERAPPAAQVLGPLQGLDTAAARDRRLAVLSHPDSMLPSSGVVGLAHAMRQVMGRLAGGAE